MSSARLIKSLSYSGVLTHPYIFINLITPVSFLASPENRQCILACIHFYASATLWSLSKAVKLETFVRYCQQCVTEIQLKTKYYSWIEYTVKQLQTVLLTLIFLNLLRVKTDTFYVVKYYDVYLSLLTNAVSACRAFFSFQVGGSLSGNDSIYQESFLTTTGIPFSFAEIFTPDCTIQSLLNIAWGT